MAAPSSGSLVYFLETAMEVGYGFYIVFDNLSRIEAWASLFGFVLPFPCVLYVFPWWLQYERCTVNVLSQTVRLGWLQMMTWNYISPATLSIVVACQLSVCTAHVLQSVQTGVEYSKISMMWTARGSKKYLCLPKLVPLEINQNRECTASCTCSPLVPAYLLHCVCVLFTPKSPGMDSDKLRKHAAVSSVIMLAV